MQGMFNQHLYRLQIVVVKANLIHSKLFHTTIRTNLHYNMHTFTIYAWILNTLNFVDHSNTRFIIIS